MEMLMVICDRDLTSKIIKLLNEGEIKYHVSFYGKGTASNEILSYFGLAKSKKEIIISLVDKDKAKEAMQFLEKHPFMTSHGAVALTVPMDAIGKNTLDFINMMGE